MKKLTEAELAALPAKTKKDPEVVQIYLEHDFLTAYALHTDRRVLLDGPESAVGAAKDWERHGELQFEYLKLRGMKRDDLVLEIGCGTGRLARKLVPWLDEGCYCGVDISSAAIASCKRLAVTEGWADRFPMFRQTMPPTINLRANLAWAFSVFIHLPAEEIVTTMRAVHARLSYGGRFFFSFVPEEYDGRTGLKQFRHSYRTWRLCAAAAGFEFNECPSWNGEQRMAIARAT